MSNVSVNNRMRAAARQHDAHCECCSDAADNWLEDRTAALVQEHYRDFDRVQGALIDAVSMDYSPGIWIEIASAMVKWRSAPVMADSDEFAAILHPLMRALTDYISDEIQDMAESDAADELELMSGVGS